MEELAKHYDFETLIDLMNNENISFEIKEAFCHLFTNLYVQVQDHSRLKLDHFIVEWDKLKDTYAFAPLAVETMFKYKPIKYFISQTINYHFEVVNLKQEEAVHQLAYLKAIIELAKKMMEAGFYTELKEINALVKGLKRVLGKSFTYMYAKAITSKDQDFTLTRTTVFQSKHNEQSAFDMNIALVQLRECRIAICDFFEFIGKIMIMLKQNTAMFRLKNIIQTATGAVAVAAEEEEGHFIYFQDKRMRVQEIMDKIGFLIKNMTKEEGFIKIGHDQQSTKQLVALLLSMSFDSNVAMKVHAINILMSLFSNCLKITESMASVIAIEDSTSHYNESMKIARDEISNYLISFKSTTNTSLAELVDKTESRFSLMQTRSMSS